MTLEEFQKESKLSTKALGAALGVGEEAARLYLRGKRIPRAAVMRKIVEITKGTVTADSFYSSPDAVPDEDIDGEASAA